MKRAEVIVVLLSAILFVVGLLTQIEGERMTWKSDARFLLSSGSNDWWYHDPHLLERQMAAISNTLHDPTFARTLAEASDVKQSDFRLIGFGGIRQTRIVYVRVAGSDRDSVQRVASNSFVMLEKFCFTNQPFLEVEYLDVVPVKRVSFLQKVRDETEYRLPH